MAQIDILLRRVWEMGVLPEAEVYVAVNELVDMRESLERYQECEDSVAERILDEFQEKLSEKAQK